MSKSIGIDIVEFSQIKEKINNRFIERILSKEEKKRYDNISNEQRKLEYIGGRFAAKEAYTKVYKEFNENLNFVDVEVLNDVLGAPYIKSKYKPKDKILISISHSRNYVVAICTLE